MSLFDILGGLNDAKVVHKDLKGENMIINIQNEEVQYIKLIDFDMAKKLGA